MPCSRSDSIQQPCSVTFPCRLPTGTGYGRMPPLTAAKNGSDANSRAARPSSRKTGVAPNAIWAKNTTELNLNCGTAAGTTNTVDSVYSVSATVIRTTKKRDTRTATNGCVRRAIHKSSTTPAIQNPFCESKVGSEQSGWALQDFESPQFRRCLTDRGFDRVVVGHVACRRERVASELPNLRGNAVHLVHGAGTNGDVRASLRKLDCNRAADAPSATGDQRDFALQRLLDGNGQLPNDMLLVKSPRRPRVLRGHDRT